MHFWLIKLHDILFALKKLFKLKALNEELSRLSKKRDQGLKAQKDLFDNYELTCKRLGEVPEVIEGLNERVCFGKIKIGLRVITTSPCQFFVLFLDSYIIMTHNLIRLIIV